jgi:hypothetical protein
VLMAPAPCGRSSQRVFHFGKGKSEGNKNMKELVRGSFFCIQFACFATACMHMYAR